MPGTTPSATFDVALNRAATTYSRNVFGHFVEHFHRQVYGGIFDPASPLSDAAGFREDVIEAMRELRPSIVRWPGGCFVSSYHWLDGVGPERRRHYDKAWRVSDPNTFGTHEFVDWCAAIGAAPYICTNAGTGSAEEMSDWVEYCNLPEGGRWSDLRSGHGRSAPLAVPYWSIGNENYGSWEMGAKTPEEWSSLVRESAKMMRNVDGSVTLLTAARSDLEWTLPLLLSAGPYLDMVSIHGYWDTLNQVNEPVDYLTAMGRSLAPQDDIQQTTAIIRAAGLGDRVGIAVDEWNLRGWHHPTGTSAEAVRARDENDDNSTYTMADALFSASFLNTCLRSADTVRMANIAPSVNARGPLFVHPDGVVRRTTFHVLAMYATMLGSQVADMTATSDELTSAGVPVVDVLATTDAERGRVVLALVNRHPSEPVTCEALIQGHPVSGSFAATVLQGEHPDAYNDVDRPDAVRPEAVTAVFRDGRTVLRPHSLTVCEIALPISYEAGVLGGSALPGDTWRLTSSGWGHVAG